MNYPYDIIPTESSLRNYPYGIIPTELSLRNYPYGIIPTIGIVVTVIIKSARFFFSKPLTNGETCFIIYV
ncbi:MAG: hypothetical protein DWQ51_11665 [Microcystis wesenbergii TW10]|uniref:Uncharacterized protein n=1 Tax=Microcystis wesenbergii TW10 TaxID=2060474 RepID=A0A3E0LX87_9CHRO|nr:MAG: hypothetical protein DWQ51_11665 [Microcystis wesenbergii TW10]